MDLLINNADIVDGTGRAARKGSIGAVNGKIILDPAQDTADLVINADGYDADLVLFNYDRLQDQATYADSNRLTDGIEYVIVGGQIVYHNKKLTGAYPGKLILREKA